MAIAGEGIKENLAWDDLDAEIQTGEELAAVKRQKRGMLREQVDKLRSETDKRIELLH